MLDHVRNVIEQNIIYQFIATFLCSIHSAIIYQFTRASNNKWVVGTIVIILGSIYPLILKYTKNGQSKYPFMIGVAVCVKNVFMLIYYFARYLTFLYTESHSKVHNYSHIDIDQSPSASFHASHHNFFTDNTSHQLSPHFQRHRHHKMAVEIPQNNIHNTSSSMMKILASTPSKISNLLHNNIPHKKAKNSSQSLHKLAKEESEITTLADHSESMSSININNNMQPIEMENININAKYSDSENIKQPIENEINNYNNFFGFKFPSIDRIKHRFKLYCYLAPNALLVLINDILALYTLSFVSVATYAVFMQVTILFIVIVRYFCLHKSINKSQLLSVVISVCGMVVFELIELEPKILDNTRSVLKDEDAKGDMIGIGLCMVRGIFKACDLVYVEWFIHHLNEIPFYEKQAIVSVWFVICSMTYVIFNHGNDLFINGRNLFDGFNDITWIFVGYGTFFALMIYLLILRLDSMVMGFCQQMTVLFAVSLDVICFGTKVTGSMWIAASIVVMAIIQYSVIQYEHLEVNKKIKYFEKRIWNDKKRNDNRFVIDSDGSHSNNNNIQLSDDEIKNNNQINTHIIHTIDSD